MYEMDAKWLLQSLGEVKPDQRLGRHWHLLPFCLSVEARPVSILLCFYNICRSAHRVFLSPVIFTFPFYKQGLDKKSLCFVKIFFSFFEDAYLFTWYIKAQNVYLSVRPLVMFLTCLHCELRWHISVTSNMSDLAWYGGVHL